MAHLKTSRVGTRTALALVVGALGANTTGCLNRPIEPVEPRTTKTVVEALPVAINRLDIVLAIDNSSSMGDKQKILGDAVPQLVDRLVNPSCVAADGSVAPTQPPKSSDPCPDGFKREFKPISDINVGIIDSSLGDMNGGTCAVAKHPDDQGHLITRGTQGTVPTYQGHGFLNWDPNGDRGGTTDPGAIKSSLKDMVLGTGQDGCGFEMQLESVVRFLVDPAPYAKLDVVPNGAGSLGSNRKTGEIDTEVLTERANFLRPDSLVAILMLTDENDCSFKPEGPGYNLMTDGGFYKPSSACASNPDDKCCYSCGAIKPPDGCPTDPACAPDANGIPRYSTSEDTVDLRCWDQKRRYGIDFLYPTQRYVNAFTQRFIDPTNDDLSVTKDSKQVRNPLFDNLDGEKVTTRTSDRVYFAGIVGVPWQAIARTTDGKPDIKKGFKSYGELVADKLFTKLVGDPSKHIPPTDPFMVESSTPRQGTSDVLDASPSQQNSINGGDIQTANKHLEYACVFDLDCGSACDGTYCSDNPDLCVNGVQTRAKGYPGLRELSVLEGMKDQGIVASVCPATLTDPNDIQSYGYDPAVTAIVDQLKVKLNAECLPTQLNADNNGQVDCIAIEARTLASGETCACDGLARAPVDTPHAQAVKAIKDDPESEPTWDCFCQITQIKDKADLTDCQNVSDDQLPKSPANGWCYLDATTNPPIGDPALLESCRADERHAVRFVNKGEPAPGARAIITCANE